jgi:hypothetical protein
VVPTTEVSSATLSEARTPRIYDRDGVEIRLDEEGKLEVVADKPEGQEDGDDGPRVVKADELPRQEQYSDEESWQDAVWDHFLDKGDEGFDALCRELVPCLKSSLTILAGDSNNVDHACFAEVLVVQPGAKEVATLKFAPDAH